MKPGCWIDGQAADVLPLTDRGLHYGDGLFETLAVKDGRIRRLDLHLDRLREGCARLALPMPEATQLKRELQAAADGQVQAVLKLMLTRGSGGRGYRPPESPSVTRILFRYPWPDHPATWHEDGIELKVCTTRLGISPALAGLKHLNRLEQVLARAEWTEGAPEGVMLDAEGYVVEGTMTNIFFSPDSKILLTADVSRAGVAGVVRRHILQMTDKLDIPAGVRRLTLPELLDQKEIFVCNSIAGVWPVTHIDSHHYAVGPMTRLAQRWVEES